MPEREEREIPRGCLVADKWLCWLPLVELVATWLGVCNGGEREKVAETGKRLILWLTLDPVFFSLRA